MEVNLSIIGPNLDAIIITIVQYVYVNQYSNWSFKLTYQRIILSDCSPNIFDYNEKLIYRIKLSMNIRIQNAHVTFDVLRT